MRQYFRAEIISEKEVYMRENMRERNFKRLAKFIKKYNSCIVVAGETLPIVRAESSEDALFLTIYYGGNGQFSTAFDMTCGIIPAMKPKYTLPLIDYEGESAELIFD